MEDLFTLIFFAVAAAIALMVVTAGFVLAATVVATCVFGAATHAFVVTLKRGIVHRGGAAAVSGPGEPAFRAYYRRQVWNDLGLAARAAWAGATRETAKIRGWVPATWSPGVRAVTVFGLAVYAYVGLAVGALFAVVIGVVPALLVALVAGVAWALGAPLRAIERLRRKRSGTHYDCPECHDRFPLPRYVCPSCDARHGELAPGPFGVLRHRCTCGARLPAVQFRGRERLGSECPAGHRLGESVGVVRTFHVPVGGGPSTGKSTFLAASLLELEHAAAEGTVATTVQSTSRAAYDQALDAFNQGVAAPKTSGLPPAMVAEVRGRSRSALLYAYDVAGEVYRDEEELRRDPAHGLAEGVVLLVDPFSLDRVRSDLGDALGQEPGIRPSDEGPQRMLERLTGVLAEQGTDLRRIRAAICVTKVDALGVGDAIAASPGDDDSARTRAWLEQQGAGNFLRAAETEFREVRCFPVSALGRTPGTGNGAFVPRGAVAPMLWLLSRAGIEPAAPGEAQQTTTERLTAAAPVDVTPKRPLLTTPVDAVSPIGSAMSFGVGALAAAALALVSLPFASLDRTTTTPDYALAASPETADGDGDAASTEPDTASGEEDEAFDDGTTGSGGPDDEEPAGERRSTYNPNRPSNVIKRHYRHLGDGEFEEAFALISSEYRASNPNWVGERSSAQPYVDVAEVGETRFEGGGVAYVPIRLYARDTYDTSNSDTTCRRFDGEVRMVKEGSAWRYSPRSGFTVTELPSDLDVCNP